MFGVAIVDQRVKLRLPKEPPERCELGRPQFLLAEHQHGMARESLLDPGQDSRIQRPRDINAQRLGSQRAPIGTKPRSVRHHVVLPRFDDLPGA